MRCYTVAASHNAWGPNPYIRVHDGHIRVGERGRGRHEVLVPLPADAKLNDDGYLIECDGPPTSALVLIRDHSGFRGGWHLRKAWTEEEWDTFISTGIAPPIPADKTIPCRIIAKGFCAQGDAGRMGGGPEYLLMMSHGDAVEIVRSGRLYGDPRVVRVECQAGLVIITDPAADAESRKAARIVASVAAQSDTSEPVVVTLGWGGGGTSRRQAEALKKRPVLRDANGTEHIFQGESIPNVVTVLRDVSLTTGYHRSQYWRWECVLHPGVTLLGDRDVSGGEVQ